MNLLHPKKFYKLNYIAIVPPLMGILSEIGVWMPILNVFSIFLGIMGITFGIFYIIKIKKSTKKRISEFGLIALGNIIWIVTMLICAIMKFSSASYADSTSSDFINQLTGFECRTDKNKQSQEKSAEQENSDIYLTSGSEYNEEQSKKNKTLKNYKVNDTVRLEGIQITLTDVQKKFKIDGNNFAPKQGSQFVKVKVKIENISVSELNVSENDIKIKDSMGAVENPFSATYTLDDQFESATLTSGGIREGAVIFEVPKNDDRLTLIYQEPISNGAQVEFNL